MPQDLQKALDATDLTSGAKADVWDAYYGAQSKDEFRTRFDKLKVPDKVKATLWDLKWSSGVEKPPATKVDPSEPGTKAGGFMTSIVSQTKEGTLGALPAIGGTIGAVAGARVGAPVRGAVIGGGLGRRAQQYIEALSNRRELPPLGTALSEVAESAVTQGGYEVGGGLVTAPFVGPLKRAIGPAQAKLLATDKAVGMRLSVAEILSGTTKGKFLAVAQHAAGRSASGQAITEAARREGEANTQRFIDSLLSHFAPKTGTVATGEAGQAGIRAGKKGMEATTRKTLNDIIVSEAPIALQNTRTEAQRLLHSELIPRAEQVSGAARLRKQGVELSSRPIEPKFPSELGPNAIKRMRPDDPVYQAAIKAGEEEQQKSIQSINARADRLLQRELNKSKAYQQIRNVLNMEDTVDFQQAVTRRSEMLQLGKNAEKELLTTKEKGAMTQLTKTLRDEMAEHSPDWALASGSYGKDARLFSKDFIKKVATKDPETLLNSLTTKAGASSPSKVVALRQILLEKAPGAGATAEGKAAWNQVRRAWFEKVVIGQDLTQMGTRLEKVEPDTLRAYFGDAQGQQFVQVARDIGAALKARIHAPNSRLFEIMEVASMGAAIGTGALGRAAKLAGGLEGIPALVTWALFNPTMKKLLLEGVTSTDPRLAASALFRLVGEYVQDQDSQDDGGRLPAVPGGGASKSTQ